MPQDFLFYYLYQQAQVNTVAPSGTCASHSAATRELAMARDNLQIQGCTMALVR